MSFASTGGPAGPGYGPVETPLRGGRRAALTRRAVLATAGGALAMAAMPARPRAAEATTLTVGLLEFGTVAWEVETIRAHRLDAAEGLAVEPARLASNDAGRIAFLGGAVDIIVTDLLWAARMRAEGRGLAFIPFSATEGAVMAAASSPVQGVGDLAGRSIGVAGGPLDKSWLLLQAYARKTLGIDLAASARPAFGAPPLLSQKLEAGELDAALLFWNFCAKLEAKGFRRVIGADEITLSFGFEAPIAFLGYAVSEAVVARDPRAVTAFARASHAAKAVLASDDAAWQAIRPLMQADDDAAFAVLRRRFLEGIPRRPVADEAADAARLYAVLAELGGDKLVGPAKALPEGLYWAGA